MSDPVGGQISANVRRLSSGNTAEVTTCSAGGRPIKRMPQMEQQLAQHQEQWAMLC